MAVKTNRKVGLLPLYIKLYDDSTPEMREKIDPFHKLISNLLRERGLDVVDVPVCRIKPEFQAAIEKFEAEEVDAIVTLHLAYSPSLESSDILANTKLPIIVLDTTPDYVYDAQTDPVLLDYNHGIHGVQDMCCMLRRNKKTFIICAGHYQNSDVLDQVIKAVDSAVIAKSLKNARVGFVGEAFEGMGDFQLSDAKLKELIGFDVVHYNDNDDAAFSVTDAELEEEYKYFADKYACDKEITRELSAPVNKTALKLRKWIESEGLDAFSMNFLSSSKDKAGFLKVPFAEASRAMEKGIGYAGEGDVMDAALVSALMKIYPETTFTEMFCPDWKNGRVFLSHMGEFNPKCALPEMKYKFVKFIYTDAGDTTALVGTLKPGKVVYVNLVPEAEDKFTLIVSACEVVIPEGENRHTDGVNGWIKLDMSTADFLRTYSENGGTHHSAMVYNGDIDVIKGFARLMGWNVVQI